MTKPFFVMLNNQKGTQLVPLVDPDRGELLMFATRQEAEDAAQRTVYGIHFGFEVHESCDYDTSNS